MQRARSLEEGATEQSSTWGGNTPRSSQLPFVFQRVVYSPGDMQALACTEFCFALVWNK